MISDGNGWENFWGKNGVRPIDLQNVIEKISGQEKIQQAAYAGQEIASDFSKKIEKKELKKRLSSVNETDRIVEVSNSDNKERKQEKKKKDNRIDIVV